MFLLRLSPLPPPSRNATDLAYPLPFRFPALAPLRLLPPHPGRALIKNLASASDFTWRRPCSPLPPSPAAWTAADRDPGGGFDEELRRLLVLLPEEMRRRVEDHPELRHLVEIVMDLGRRPLARFPSGDFFLSDRPISPQDLHHATSQVGDFAADNRAGISRTLHRISAIRNRKGAIIGLTCRVGRAVSGSANLLHDLVKDGGSLLLIGPPGVGKTTIIREIARMLADDYKRRVMIVDTSNEIGGDGDIPHAGIGGARRLQVPNSDMQHKSVTLGDEEASRRGVQKTVLERKGPSTFTCGAEIISKTELRVHHSLEATVDALLAGRSPNFQVRKIGPKGSTKDLLPEQKDSLNNLNTCMEDAIVADDHLTVDDKKISDTVVDLEFAGKGAERSHQVPLGFHLYVYGITEASVLQVITQLEMGEMITLTYNISEADAFLALHSKLKKNPHIQAFAKSRNKPIFVTKTNSLVQITKAIRALINQRADGFKAFEAEERVSQPEKTDALEEVRLAIEQVVIPRGKSIQLLPRPSHIISIQIDLIEKYKLKWELVGEEPGVFLRILPLEAGIEEKNLPQLVVDGNSTFEEVRSPDGFRSSQNGAARLPRLPE